MTDHDEMRRIAEGSLACVGLIGNDESRLARGVLDLLAEVGALRSTLTTISEIRDSIVGLQGFNFSEHAYPLVAALDAAGFKGVGHAIAKKNLGTLIEQIKAAEAEAGTLRSALRECCDGWRQAIAWNSLESCQSKHDKIEALRKLADGAKP